MAQNYISRGEVITIQKAERSYESGSPYRIIGFNGIALSKVATGEILQFQVEGIWELELADVKAGQLIYICPANLSKPTLITNTQYQADPNPGAWATFGRAVTGTDEVGKFYCRILQREY